MINGVDELVNKLLLAATLLGSAVAPSVADARKRPAPPPPPAPVQVVPSEPIEAFYYRHGNAPLWFRNAETAAAGARLSAILKRAPIDGFTAGPQLAAGVDAVLAKATTSPAAAAAADRVLSRAWVAYVQHLKTPPKGMVFGYDMLKPAGARPDQILLTAAAAPSLVQHIDRTADVNPHYRQIREAALASGMVAADARLLANLERARVLPAGGRYIIVDSAVQRLTMYENGQPVDSMKVVVGTGETPTPLISSIMHYVTLNPYWNVPPNLIRKTVAPNAVKQGQSYLKPRGYEVVDGWTKDAPVIPPAEIDWKAIASGAKSVRVRQLPGAGNSMGKMKFPFPSGQDIYLHDTPQKEYFAKAQRNLSNGCIRLEDARRLGRWLLGREPVAASSEPEQFVQLPQGVPIYLTYLTAQVQDGKLAYVNDFYSWDSRPDLQVAASTMYTTPVMR
jgi:murein L,D-transpeptidase YcbB/YkuD